MINKTPIIAREEESQPGFDERKMTALLSATGNHDDTGVVVSVVSRGDGRWWAALAQVLVVLAGGAGCRGGAEAGL
jgi:hypothetical protein